MCIAKYVSCPKSPVTWYLMTIIVVRSDVLLLWQNNECNGTFGTTLVHVLLEVKVCCSWIQLGASGVRE